MRCHGPAVVVRGRGKEDAPRHVVVAIVVAFVVMQQKLLVLVKSVGCVLRECSSRRDLQLDAHAPILMRSLADTQS